MKTIKIFGTHQKVRDPELVAVFVRELVKSPPKSPRALEQLKYKFSSKHKVQTIQNRDLLAISQKENIDIPPQLEKLLQKRAVRTISGVSPIGILTKPYACPGKCVYCPTEDRMPKSYMSNQPAAARAVRNNFHPHRQVKNRMTALEESGHPISKLEIIVMGGTWSFLPHKYQSWYIKKCFDAANGDEEVVHNRIKGQVLSIKGKKKKNIPNTQYLIPNTLAAAQKKNETTASRIIGLTLETRPDFINEKELVRMRRYGCTRIEIGVQTLDDEVQKLTKRGHKKTHVIRAMKLMRDFGFKVCIHLMPGLPGSTPEKDIVWLREVFENPDFRPDFVKIYPCVVLETAELKTWWGEGRYKPYTDEDLVRLLLQFKTFVPPWTRIMRLMRDIPVSNIVDGAKLSNLRQILKDQPWKMRELVGDDFYNQYVNDKWGPQNHKVKALKEANREPHRGAVEWSEASEALEDADGWPCRCIRCREVGFKTFSHAQEVPTPVLKRRNYEASEGQEVFLSFESEDESHLFALLRLRKPSGQKFNHFQSVLSDAALIREVHSYGSEVSVGDESGLGQHRGLGKALIEEAERIARDEWGLRRMTIIAGVGTREYYRKWGYKLQSTYMTKSL
ncbi:MAG TPA: tRNA uridine(34) 5-carboxymethylaminomethyl modification radical SAM/GNAT enzyme Elp3 [Candidatus Gracilibacteria bacterium]